MKKIVLMSTVAFFMIVITSSYIYQKEVVKATSGWFYSWTDADTNCKEKLAQKGGNSTGEVIYYEREEGQDGMKKKTYKVSCSCYKKEDK